MLLFQVLMVAALLVMGMGIALLGTIKVELARRLAIDEARVGGLISLFGFTIIPIVFGVGYLTDGLGKRIVVVAGCALVVASLATLAQAKSYAAALVGSLLLGAGWSALVNVGNVLTPAAFARGPDDTAYATNLANVFFGAGAFLTPLLMAFLLARVKFMQAMLVLAGLAAVPGLLGLVVDIDAITQAPAETASPNEVAEGASTSASNLQAAATGAPAQAAKAERVKTISGNTILWLCGLAFFCYFPMEASMSGWTTTLLTARGLGEQSAARIFSGFWLAYLGSRLLTALALPSGWGVPLVLALSALCILILLCVAFARGQSEASWAVLAAGFAFGPIFPTTMAVLLDNVAPEFQGRAVGLAIALGGVGSSTMPLLIGALARRTSLSRAFLVTVALSAGLSLIYMVLQFGM